MNLYGNDVKISEDKKVCCICMSNEPDTVLDPCGHTVCLECFNKLKTKNCPYCREPIQKPIKLYI